MPDAEPPGGLKGEPVRIVAAQGEYEPGSFVITADTNEGKVDFAVSPLKSKEGATIPVSEIDLKTVKVFGKDISRAERIFRAHQRTDYQLDRERGFVQFSPECAQLLKKTDMQLGISYNLREFREGESVIRELRLDLEEAAEFRPEEL